LAATLRLFFAGQRRVASEGGGRAADLLAEDEAAEERARLERRRFGRGRLAIDAVGVGPP